MSPPRSPARLPSPPPPTEDFTGPQSPSLTTPADINNASPSFVDQPDRRIRPGTKAADMMNGPPMEHWTEIDSAFQLMEYLKACHHYYTHPDDKEETCALSKAHADILASPPPGVDRSLWLYELCRFLVQKINAIVTSLFSDTPACSSITCPEMRASEWQYLCAVHDPPKPCCAIDYCCHTLDWAASILTNPKHFPSRLALNINKDSAPSSPTSAKSSQAAAPNAQQVRQLTNICRRVYRIFAHAWFQHRDMFWRVEHETGLYVFFKTVCDVYNLIPADNYTIPPEAEGEEAAAKAAEAAAKSKAESGEDGDEDAVLSSASAAPAPSILRRPAEQAHIVDASAGSNTVVAAGGAARRHRRDLSRTVPNYETVTEEAEEDEDDNGLRPNTLRETDTQILVPQVGEGGSKQEARPSSFPSFDDEDDEDEGYKRLQARAEAAVLRHLEEEPQEVRRSSRDELENLTSDAAAQDEEEDLVVEAKEQAHSSPADADAAGQSVQD